MAMNKQILSRIARDLGQLGIAYTQNADYSVTVDGLTVSYAQAAILSPMGGIDSTISPFLGIGTSNPGQITITTGAVIASSFVDATKLKVLALCAGFANDITVICTDATVRIRGNVDNLGLGQ